MCDPGLPLRGRLAPSPTGRIHLGNAFAFLMAWAFVRKAHGVLVMRVEDIDPVRSREHFVQGVLDDLHWLGLDWDEGPGCMNKGGAEATPHGPFGPYQQSRAFALYTAALDVLHSAALVYPCFCTRKDLKTLASAPHLEDGSPVYDGRCRRLAPAEREKRMAQGRYTLRLDVATAIHSGGLPPETPAGTIEGLLQAGDFALMRSDGVPAYQLAVVVDDGRMGITQVVRGNDLAASTPRQKLLLSLLGYTPPEYIHIPLLYAQDGERLAKRHNSLEIAALREKGVRPEQIVGLLAWLAGCNPAKSAMPARQFLADCNLDLVARRQRIVLPSPAEALFFW